MTPPGGAYQPEPHVARERRFPPRWVWWVLRYNPHERRLRRVAEGRTRTKRGARRQAHRAAEALSA